MQKVRCHLLLKLQLLIGLLVQVLFHQSSTYFSPFTHVTLHYRQICYTQPWRMVPPYSYKADVLILLNNIFTFITYRTFTFYGRPENNVATILMSTYSKVLCVLVKILAILVSLTITPRVSFDFLSYWYCNVLLPNVLYYSVYLRIV